MGSGSRTSDSGSRRSLLGEGAEGLAAKMRAAG
jgi:hypothetical protein